MLLIKGGREIYFGCKDGLYFEDLAFKNLYRFVGLKIIVFENIARIGALPGLYLIEGKLGIS